MITASFQRISISAYLIYHQGQKCGIKKLSLNIVFTFSQLGTFSVCPSWRVSQCFALPQHDE